MQTHIFHVLYENNSYSSDDKIRKLLCKKRRVGYSSRHYGLFSEWVY